MKNGEEATMVRRSRCCTGIGIPPHDIMVDILHRLPSKSHSPSKSVCKDWGSLISDPKFVESYFDRSGQDSAGAILFSFGFDRAPTSSTLDRQTNSPVNFHYSRWDNLERPPPLQFKILGSCNGLLLVYVRTFSSCFLLNPWAHTCRGLPSPCQGSFFFKRLTVPGLVYCPSADDYKVVLCDGDFGYVWSLKAQDWRSIAVRLPYSYSYRRATLVQDNLHWVAKQDYGAYANFIIYFDSEHERFKELPPHPPHTDDGDYKIKLVSHNGEEQLCFIYVRSQGRYGGVWVILKKIYNREI